MTPGLVMLRASQLGLRPADLEEITEGQLCDMLIEAQNDSAQDTTTSSEAVREATQEDIDRFFGG